jgi:hypothetical protein
MKSGSSLSYRWVPLLAASAFVLAACTTEPPPPNIGTFEMQVTGDLTMQLQGEAYFGDMFEQLEGGVGRRFWAIELQNFTSDPYHIVRIEREDWGAPTVGTHQISANASATTFTAAYLVIDASGEHTHVEVDAVSGTLNITQVTPEWIYGTLTFTGSGQSVPTAGAPPIPLHQVHFQGSFEAARGM